MVWHENTKLIPTTGGKAEDETCKMWMKLKETHSRAKITRKKTLIKVKAI